MAQKKAASYQEMNKELESLLSDLQSSDMDIDEALKAYERGMELVKDLEAYLKTAENKVIKIKTQFEKG